MIDEYHGIETLTDDQILPALADHTAASSLCIRSRPNARFYQKLNQRIEQTGARGVILKTLSFCDLWFTEKRRMAELLPVPLLVLDSGFGSGSEARLQTRIDTFLEMIA